MRCQELIELEDGDMASCHEEAAYTTCRIKNGAVCEAHKCRCSRPLAEVDDAARREASEMAQCRSCRVSRTGAHATRREESTMG